jgi:hypothetical protein
MPETRTNSSALILSEKDYLAEITDSYLAFALERLTFCEVTNEEEVKGTLLCLWLAITFPNLWAEERAAIGRVIRLQWRADRAREWIDLGPAARQDDEMNDPETRAKAICQHEEIQAKFLTSETFCRFTELQEEIAKAGFFRWRNLCAPESAKAAGAARS